MMSYLSQVLLWLLFLNPALAGAADPTRTIMPPDEVEFRLKHLSPEMRDEIISLTYILTPPQLTELLTLTLDYKQRRWIDRYWQHRDPVYTTAENEIQEEHQRRVEIALANFYNAKRGKIDQRGEVYIRYGPPLLRRIIEPETGAKGVTCRGEFWYYNRPDIYILFDDAHSDGHYTYYLRKAGGGSSMRLDRIGDPIDATNAIELAPPSIVYESLYDEYEEKLANFFELKETTPSTYRYDFEDQRLPFVFSVENFRGGDFTDRVDVNIEFLADCSWRDTGDLRNDYLASAVFWDRDRQEVGRRQQRLGIPLVRGAADSTRWMPSQLVFSLPPGFYHLAVTVEETNTGRINSYRTDTACEDYDSKLAISDILFALAIKPVSQMTPFNRGALEVVPHPMRRYRKPAPIQAYFEIYNLKTDERGLSKYSLEYRLIPGTPKKTGWWQSLFGRNYITEISSSLEGSSYGPHDVIRLSVQTDNLWADDYKFIVQLVDENSQQTQTREAAFTVVD